MPACGGRPYSASVRITRPYTIFANQRLYVQKTAAVDGVFLAGQVRYWIEYQKGGFNLSGKNRIHQRKMALPTKSHMERYRKTD